MNSQKLFAEHSRNNTPKLFRERCNCLQSCISITYDADLDRVNLNTANPNDEPDMPPLPPNSNRPNRPPKPNESNRPWYLRFIIVDYSPRLHIFNLYSDPFKFSLRSSHVRIFFNHHEVDTLRRSETYTLSNFMAICGGLLGLFLGEPNVPHSKLVSLFSNNLYLSMASSYRYVSAEHHWIHLFLYTSIVLVDSWVETQKYRSAFQATRETHLIWYT